MIVEHFVILMILMMKQIVMKTVQNMLRDVFNWSGNGFKVESLLNIRKNCKGQQGGQEHGSNKLDTGDTESSSSSDKRQLEIYSKCTELDLIAWLFRGCWLEI